MADEAPRKQRILVVDDTKDILLVVSRRLQSWGYEAFTAESGEEGLQLAVKHLPDLILLDIMMPKMKGRDVCARLKADQKPDADDQVVDGENAQRPPRIELPDRRPQIAPGRLGLPAIAEQDARGQEPAQRHEELQARPSERGADMPAAHNGKMVEENGHHGKEPQPIQLNAAARILRLIDCRHGTGRRLTRSL